MMTLENVQEGPARSKSATKPTINVEVLATRDWDNGVSFLCLWEYPTGVWNSGAMVFADGDSDRHIEYTLNDKTGLGLDFKNIADEAIWVDFGGCPTAKPAAGSDKGQIKDKNRPASKKLKLKNANDQLCKLHYALRFDGSAYGTPEGNFGPTYEYDPEYRNGGGGGSNT